MARAEVASASVNSDSIKGLAQSIAKPAYRRLLTAEPALRRAVPALIIAFLLTICVGAVVQVLDHRRLAIGDLGKQIEATADFLAERLDAFEKSKRGKSERPLQAELERMIPSWARVPGRHVLVANADGVIVAASVRSGEQRHAVATSPLTPGRPITTARPDQPLTTFAAFAGSRKFRRRRQPVATVRSLGPNGVPRSCGRARAVAAGVKRR
jgi:two-component system cell cycle sensor histidine kinase PleC